METSGLDTVFLWVSDLDRSTAFYRDMLGMLPGPRYGAWQVMESGGPGASFALHGADGVVEPSRSAVVGFRVVDLDAATDQLAGAGYEPKDPEPTDTGVKRFRTFADPDGHVFQLIELA